MYARLGGVGVLELATQSARDDGQRLAAKVLAQLEELKEAQSVALVIVGEIALGKGVVPAVFVQGTVLNGAHRVLPLIACLEVGTLNNTAAREAEHARMHVVQCLCQVLTHAVLATLPCLDREERNMLHISGSLAVAPHTQVCLVEGASWFDDSGVFLPFLAAYVHACVAQLLVVAHGSVVHQVDPQLGLAAIGHTGPY